MKAQELAPLLFDVDEDDPYAAVVTVFGPSVEDWTPALRSEGHQKADRSEVRRRREFNRGE